MGYLVRGHEMDNVSFFTAQDDGVQVNFLGEKKMWAETIRLAILDIKAGTKKRKTESQTVIRNYESAKGWLLRKKDKRVGSFIWVCDFLRLNPELVRTQILRIEQ